MKSKLLLSFCNGRNPQCLLQLFVLLFIPVLLISYKTFLSQSHFPTIECPSCSFLSSSLSRSSTDDVAEELEPADPGVPTNISHIFFGIAGSAETWKARRAYSEVWWRPGVTRGYVWLDKQPAESLETEAKTNATGDISSSDGTSFPPFRISETVDTSRFGNRESAVRIARIVLESHRLLESNLEAGPAIRWLVMGDDDTVFFLENLVAVLGRYNHREMYYIGGMTESVEQGVTHGFSTAFGGAGFAVSLPAAREASRIFDACLERYQFYWGSDERIRSCLAEVGVPLTREIGFHQLDVKGEPSGILAAHPVAPLISLHHLDSFSPLFPFSPTQTSALQTLASASRVDPSRTLQQSVCYEPQLNWSISVSWGYTVQIYPELLPPELLATPFLTFQTWRSGSDGPFTFNTRPASTDPCEPPVKFFLDGVEGFNPVRKVVVGAPDGTGAGAASSITVYKRWDAAKCDRREHAKLRVVDRVRVAAAVMDRKEWTRRAPRRQCCEARRSWWGSTIDVRIRRCKPGEAIIPPPS